MIAGIWRAPLMTEEERHELATLVETEGRPHLSVYVSFSHSRLFELDEAE